MSQPEYDFLNGPERREMRRYLSFPEEFPKEFKEWLEEYLKINGLFTKSNIEGLFGNVSDASIAVASLSSNLGLAQTDILSLSAVNGSQQTAINAVNALTAYAEQTKAGSITAASATLADGPAVTGLAAGTWIAHYGATLSATAGTATFAVTHEGVGQIGDTLKSALANPTPQSSFIVFSTTGNGALTGLYDIAAGTATYTHRKLFAQRIA